MTNDMEQDENRNEQGNQVVASEKTEAEKAQQLEELKQLEEKIQAGQEQFCTIGSMLLHIQMNRLYTLRGYSSFDTYCKETFQITGSHGYRLIHHVRTCAILNESPKDVPEKTVRSLSTVKNEDDAREIWNKAKQENDGQIPSGKKVKNQVELYHEAQKKEEASSEPQQADSEVFPTEEYESDAADDPETYGDELQESVQEQEPEVISDSLFEIEKMIFGDDLEEGLSVRCAVMKMISEATPENQRIVSADNDETYKIWDAAIWLLESAARLKEYITECEHTEIKEKFLEQTERFYDQVTYSPNTMQVQPALF